MVTDRRVLNSKPLFLGLLLAAGTLESSTIPVALIFAGWAIWVSKSQKPHRLLGILILSIFLTIPLAFVPWHTFVIGLLILSVGIVSQHVRKDWSTHYFFYGLAGGVAIQTFFAVVTWGEQRPGLLSLNASNVAQTGLVFWLIIPELKKSDQLKAWPIAAIHMAVSLSRFPLLAAFVYAVTLRSKKFTGMFLALFLLFVIAGSSQGLLARLTPAPILSALGVRMDLAAPAVRGVRVVVDSRSEGVHMRVTGTGETANYELTTDPTRYELPVFSVTGFGVGNYIDATNIARPHNVFLMLFYEMGILAMVPIGLFVWAVATRRIPWQASLALFVLWQGVEEPVSRFEGMFTTAAVLVALWRPHKAALVQSPAKAELNPRTQSI